MVDEIIRRRVAGRRLCVKRPGGYVRGLNAVEHALGHPIGFKHRGLARIERSGYNSRVQQDMIQRIMLRQIRVEHPGPRRDWLIRDYELWLQNGRPTYGSGVRGDPRRGPVSMDPAFEARKRDQDGKPLSAELAEQHPEDQRRKLRRILGL